MRTAALAAALLAAGCASPDYRHARRTRNARPYTGGAASVPDEEPRSDCDESPSVAIEMLGFFAALGLMSSNDVDHSRGRAADYEPPWPGR